MDTKQESGSLPSGGQPGQAATPDGQNVERTSPEVPLFTQEQEAYIADLVQRTDQGLKDRAVNRLSKTVEEQQDTLDKFAALLQQPGMTPEKAKREMALDELLAKRNSAQPAANNVAPTNATSQAAPEPLNYQSIYEAVGLSPTDNDVISLTVQHGTDTAALSAALVQLKARRNGQAPASPATVAASPGGATPPTNTQIQSLENEIRALLTADPAKNLKRVQELRQEISGLS